MRIVVVVVVVEGRVAEDVEVEERDDKLLRWFEELTDEFIFEFKFEDELIITDLFTLLIWGVIITLLELESRFILSFSSMIKLELFKRFSDERWDSIESTIELIADSSTSEDKRSSNELFPTLDEEQEDAIFISEKGKFYKTQSF